MNTLPKCDIVAFPLKPFSRNVDGEYTELLKLIQEYVGADCWAFVVNNEILFNSYNNDTKSFKEIINEKIIRDKIIENAHSILVEINRREVNMKIEIYMFGAPTSYKLVILYVADSRQYIVHRMNSQAFIDKFGEDNHI
jgi:hypothetical protein